MLLSFGCLLSMNKSTRRCVFCTVYCLTCTENEPPRPTPSAFTFTHYLQLILSIAFAPWTAFPCAYKVLMFQFPILKCVFGCTIGVLGSRVSTRLSLRNVMLCAARPQDSVDCLLCVRFLYHSFS